MDSPVRQSAWRTTPFEAGLILTEVATRRVFSDAVVVNLEA
jgi:hypothetical protein